MESFKKIYVFSDFVKGTVSPVNENRLRRFFFSQKSLVLARYIFLRCLIASMSYLQLESSSFSEQPLTADFTLLLLTVFASSLNDGHPIASCRYSSYLLALYFRITGVTYSFVRPLQY